MKSFKFIALISYFLLVFASRNLGDSDDSTPDQSEIDKFIDFCYEFTETMEDCAHGWVELEHEMIDSIESFSQRILKTETLIGEEADQILVMAGRIVETESMIIDLMESCGCKDNKVMVENQALTLHNFHHKNIELHDEHSSIHFLQSHNFSNSVKLTSASTEGSVKVDHCAPVDDLIRVMEQGLDSFETFNDDFLEVLSYTDQAVNDMGDRILSTECLIMNMSLLIGDMADQIVEVESIMFNATQHCCKDNNSHLNLRSGSKNISYDVHHPSHVEKYQNLNNDDIPKDCANFILTNEDDRNLHKSPLSVSRRVIFDFSSLVQVQSNSMPCDTWWNPFCCASQICADMMIDMMNAMNSAADSMVDSMEAIIDEIGHLADDIVSTEEQIIVMGDRILEMSDCIVVFIYDGIEFAENFCPTLSVKIASEQLKLTDEVTCTSTSIRSRKSSKVATKRSASTVFSSLKTQLHNEAFKISNYTSFNGPATDFTEMIDAMMTCAKAVEEMIASQIKLLDELMDTVDNFASDVLTYTSMVDDLDDDVDKLDEDMSRLQNSMDELESC
jgi:hypothetical protein